MGRWFKAKVLVYFSFTNTKPVHNNIQYFHTSTEYTLLLVLVENREGALSGGKPCVKGRTQSGGKPCVKGQEVKETVHEGMRSGGKP